MRALSLLIIIILTTHFTYAETRFKNCSLSKRRLLLDSIDEGLLSLRGIQHQLEARLDLETYTRHESKQLKAANKRLKCITRKLPNLVYKCANKDHKTKLAHTIPFIGNSVTLFNGAFTSRFKGLPISANLIHETSHKCGAVDRTYYFQTKSNPNHDAKKKWASTASLYDWWSIYGFCIPGRDC